MKIQTIIFWTILLIALDQVIKIVIYQHYLDTNFDIIPSLFEFKPHFNDKHSYLNSLLNQKLNLHVGLWPHIILFLIIEFLILKLYFSLRRVIKRTRLLDIAFIFQLAGWVCALLGNLVWKEGTLDYIYLKPLFIFDLKDVYLNCFVIFFLIFYLKNREIISHAKTKDIFYPIKKDSIEKSN